MSKSTILIDIGDLDGLFVGQKCGSVSRGLAFSFGHDVLIINISRIGKQIKSSRSSIEGYYGATVPVRCLRKGYARYEPYTDSIVKTHTEG